MKFCYIDESGMGEERYATMVGIVVDGQRMAPTKSEWIVLLDVLSAICGRDVEELHTNEFYRGNGIWRGMDGEQRTKIIGEIIAWFENRKHHVVYSVVDREVYDRLHSDDSRIAQVGSVWRLLALHITLAIQKRYQAEKGNKGHTVLVFDNRELDKGDFTKIILKPPEWTDSYYSRGNKQGRLDTIIDVPHFVDSKHVGLIQVADLLSYLLRQHIELQSKFRPEKYNNEAETISGWVDAALKRSIGGGYIYPKRGRCDTAELFFNCAPDVLRNSDGI